MYEIDQSFIFEFENEVFFFCFPFFFRRLTTGRKYLAPVHFFGQSKAIGITAENTCEIRFVIGPLRCLSPDCSS